jgi:predicted HTH transcriptional regulator
MRIVEFINTEGKITSGKIQKMFEISRPAAYKEIKKLIELDIIEQRGSGRSTYYVTK